MDEKQLVDNAKELYDSIEDCIANLVVARLRKNAYQESQAIFHMETIICQVQQYLTNVIDYYDNRNEVQHRG